jgi:hypothetical protein
MMTGTGMQKKSGDVPPPFGLTTIFTEHALEMLRGRFTMVITGLVLISLYLIASGVVGALILSDLIFLAGSLFLMYRATKISKEIYDLEQYLHGEGLHALD